MTHHKTICKHCKKVMGQCRCPSLDKEIRYSVCSNCVGKTEHEEGSKRIDVEDNQIPKEVLKQLSYEDKIKLLAKFGVI